LLSRQGQAYAFAGVTVLLWSTVAAAFKLSLRYLDPFQLLLYANVTSVVVLAAILAARGRLRVLAFYRRGDWLRLGGLGVLNPFLYYWVLFEAYDRLPAQQAQPLNYTWAITLAILSVPLLGQPLTRRTLAALLISYVGVVVISTRGEVLALAFTSASGVALALASTVIWSLYWICNTRDRGDPVAGLLVSFCASLPLVLAATAILSELTWPGWPSLAGGIYVGLFEMGLSFVLWLQALKRSSSTAMVSNLIFLAPFGSLVFIHWLVGETIVGATYVGLALIVGGNLIQQWPERSTEGRA